jgi:uncharacterized membrane protein
MSHDDKFPPNAFLKRTIMKTPGRFMMFYLAVVVAVLVSGSLFPEQTAEVAKWGLGLLIPTAIGVTIWHIVWSYQNPHPSMHKCEKCNQSLPEEND